MFYLWAYFLGCFRGKRKRKNIQGIPTLPFGEHITSGMKSIIILMGHKVVLFISSNMFLSMGEQVTLQEIHNLHYFLRTDFERHKNCF